MPYDRNVDLPDSVRDNLPEHAQSIYCEAFNSAFETAHKVAWSAVKQKYEKRGDRWRAKD